MPNPIGDLPNYLSHSLSPDVKDLGVQIKVAPRTQEGEAIPLFGAYMLNHELVRKAEGAPLTKIMLVVFRRDVLGIWHEAVQSAHNIIPISPPAEGTIDQNYRQGGYFNVDLRDLCELVESPGLYWVLAAMSDFVSDRIAFEVTPRK